MSGNSGQREILSAHPSHPPFFAMAQQYRYTTVPLLAPMTFTSAPLPYVLFVAMMQQVLSGKIQCLLDIRVFQPFFGFNAIVFGNINPDISSFQPSGNHGHCTNTIEWI